MPFNLVRIHTLCQSGDLLEQLRIWGLVPYELLCPTCGVPLHLFVDSEDGWRWKCKNIVALRRQSLKKCNAKIRFRTGTFFERAHLSYFQILGFAHLWVLGVPLRVIKIQLDIGSDNTLVDWSSFCRYVIFMV